ncbi:WD repeat-containing protein 17-like [Neocloeon triangulifer]|uniref:WD repeat-containing protein 17-like n=1 Tax=Neocloeon triangulifer TaxID=2078957 RepID=UPI00286F96F9|nr:WD repeat-containing protein 17-like [Neocloeon triangulifer]
MRAISCLGAGTQPWISSVCTVHKDRFAYVSTLAIYIYQRESGCREWSLKSILTEPRISISALSWHPTQQKLLASTTSDDRVCIWNVEQQRIVFNVKTTSTPILIDWIPSEREQVSVVLDGGRSIVTWTPQQQPACNNGRPQHLLQYRTHSAFSSPIACLQWHPKQPGHLAVGHQDGTLSFYAAAAKVQLNVRLTKEDDGEVCSLQWDPLAEDYLLVVHRQGLLRLVSSQGVTILANFRHPATCRAHCVAWLPDCPGMFVSGDDDSGVVRVWTVGKETPLENRPLQVSGVRSVMLVATSAETQQDEEAKANNCGEAIGAAPILGSLVCLFANGGAGVHDLRRNKWDYFKEAGHVETVFACAFSPDESCTLATGSFDGSVKLWTCADGETRPLNSTPGRESIIYSVSWAPSSPLLAAATARDGVLIVDTQGARVAQRLTHHGRGVSVFCVAWCADDPRRIASAGGDNCCVVVQHKGELEVQRCQHPGSVYGCDWSGADRLATACDDAVVRVFRVACKEDAKPVELKGHSSKVFNVKWCPALDNLLCSGSDDATIRIWDVDKQACIRTMYGHKGHVRGLAWNHAFPHLIISGSWDFSIRVWDARTAECIAVENEHGADVYGISVCPNRPLLVASTSRDSTVRLWNLAPLIPVITMTPLVPKNTLDVLFTYEFSLNEEWVVRIHGEVAKTMVEILTNNQIDQMRKFLSVSDLLHGNPEVTNLWDLVMVLRGTKEMSQLSKQYPRGIVHSTHVATCRLADATQEELKAAGGHGQRAEADLRRAANSFLRAGALRRYCEVMVRLGEWDKALSVAPGVSFEYWKQINQKRINELYVNESELVLPNALAQGDLQGLVTFYSNRGQLEESFALSCLSRPKTEQAAPVVPSEESFSPLMSCTARAVAENLLRKGAPIKAACTMLAVDDDHSALQMLMRGNELELLVTVGRALNKTHDCHVDRALALLAIRARRLKEWKLAIDLLTEIKDFEMKRQGILRLLVNFPGSRSVREELLKEAGLPDAEKCAKRANEIKMFDDVENVVEAVQLLMAVGDFEEAVDLGCRIIPEILQPHRKWNPEKALRITELIQETGIVNDRIRLLSAYVGALIAIRRGYHQISQSLIENAIIELRRSGEGSCGLHEAQFHALSGLDSAMINRLKEEPSCDPDRGNVHVTGSNLPSHSGIRRCILTGMPIRGPAMKLDDSELSMVCLSDAIMWAKCGAMSPLGTAINPF